MSSPPPSGLPASPSVEERLSDELDRAAISFLQILSDDSKVGDGENAKPRYDLKTKLEVFKMAQDWLARRRRMNPDRDNDAPGIAAMQAAVKDIVDQRLDDQRVVRVPAKKPGRPRGSEAQIRADYDEVAGRVPGRPADDAKLRSMLTEGRK